MGAPGTVVAREEKPKPKPFHLSEEVLSLFDLFFPPGNKYFLSAELTVSSHFLRGIFLQFWLNIYHKNEDRESSFSLNVRNLMKRLRSRRETKCEHPGKWGIILPSECLLFYPLSGKAIEINFPCETKQWEENR